MRFYEHAREGEDAVNMIIASYIMPILLYWTL